MTDSNLTVPAVKPEPEDDSTPSLLLSATATPALDTDSKAETLDPKEELDEKVKQEQDLREDFDVPVSYPPLPTLNVLHLKMISSGSQPRTSLHLPISAKIPKSDQLTQP